MAFSFSMKLFYLDILKNKNNKSKTNKQKKKQKTKTKTKNTQTTTVDFKLFFDKIISMGSLCSSDFLSCDFIIKHTREMVQNNKEICKFAQLKSTDKH